MTSRRTGTTFTEIDYSSELVERARARWTYQAAFVAAMSPEVDAELARKERELLTNLDEKLHSLIAIHDGLLSLRASPRSGRAAANGRSAAAERIALTLPGPAP